MKTLVKNLLVNLSKNELAHLTKEVKETVALDGFVAETKRVFTAADLWSIHKRRAVRTGRKMFI